MSSWLVWLYAAVRPYLTEACFPHWLLKRAAQMEGPIFCDPYGAVHDCAQRFPIFAETVSLKLI